MLDGKLASDRDELGRAVFDRITGFLEEKKKTCDRLADQYADLGYPRFAQLERDFHDEHERRFTYCMRDQPIECIHWRIAATMRFLASRKGRRSAWRPGSNQRVGGAKGLTSWGVGFRNGRC